MSPVIRYARPQRTRSPEPLQASERETARLLGQPQLASGFRAYFRDFEWGGFAGAGRFDNAPEKGTGSIGKLGQLLRVPLHAEDEPA